MTEEQFKQMLAKATYSVQARNVHLVLPPEIPAGIKPVPAVLPSTLTWEVPQAEAKLNKTERAYLSWLRSRYTEKQIGVQNIVLVLERGRRYIPDFWVADQDGVRFIDTKGTKRLPDGRVTYWCPPKNKQKVITAAATYLWCRFFIAYQHPPGEWVHVQIKP